MSFRNTCRSFAALLALLSIPLAAPAAESFDFEDAAQLENPRISGDLTNFDVSTEQAHGGTQSIKFVDPAPLPFESWTYDLPFPLTLGSVSIWFYDARGPAAFSANPLAAKWGGSVILEDANNPSDFGAVEIAELPYGGGRYYGTEGSVDRQLAADRFDSGAFPLRSVGFHQVVFNVGATSSTITVDGLTTVQVGAPGGDKTLRLRVMCGAAGNGSAPPFTPGLPAGYVANWTLTAPGSEICPVYTQSWVYYDDLAINATAPAANNHTMGFEAPGGIAEYDAIGALFPTPIDPNDNPNQAGFVNQWDVTTTASLVHSGAQSAHFVNAAPRSKSITFDLAGIEAGGEIRLWFYDSLGDDIAQDHFGGSIIIEDGSEPANFLAAEIWNFPYPLSTDPTPGGPNYYLTQGAAGPPSNTGTLFSRVFGNRTIGWHEVVITVGAASSTITVDGVGDPTKLGPGLNTSPKLRLMGDSPTSGGFANWVGLGEVSGNYVASTDPYVYYDDLLIPVVLAARSWALYE